MKGPYKKGTFEVTDGDLKDNFQRGMPSDQVYHVIREFIDADGDRHPIGEEWELLGKSVNLYDGYCLYKVRDRLGQEWLVEFDDRDQLDESASEPFYSWQKYFELVPGQEA